MYQHEPHKANRSGWLRAAVMGANDGIVSTASLVIGVAAAGSSAASVMLAGLAGLVAGAMSMAAGEFVSVSTQSDLEQADLQVERKALENHEQEETLELAQIYQERGLEPGLAFQVAKQLMAHDALGAHARDEIGITDTSRARPILAALSSAATFTIGGSLPLLTTWLTPASLTVASVATSSLVFLALLGSLSAYAGGAPILKGTLRVMFWGCAAMLLTQQVGRLFNTVL